MPYARLTILAPGLLGGSLGLAAHALGLAREVVVWARRPEARAECAAQPWCAAAPATPEEAVSGAALVVLCPPVESILPLLERVAPHLAAGALVTDVGSTKSLICRGARAILAGREAVFVGSHPMAGSEKAGLAAARADLFHGQACFVTPLPDQPAARVEETVRLWRALGMEVRTESPERHDEIVAHISHLPHLLASALSAYLGAKDPQWPLYAGNGLRDTTRVAAGLPAVWKPIVEQNREEILRALVGFEDELFRLRSALENGQGLALWDFLERGKRFRDRLRQPG